MYESFIFQKNIFGFWALPFQRNVVEASETPSHKRLSFTMTWTWTFVLFVILPPRLSYGRWRRVMVVRGAPAPVLTQVRRPPSPVACSWRRPSGRRPSLEQPAPIQTAGAQIHGKTPTQVSVWRTVRVRSGPDTQILGSLYHSIFLMWFILKCKHFSRSSDLICCIDQLSYKCNV